MATIEELEPRPVRRLGSGVVHFAAYGDELRQPATHFGAPFMHVGAPLVALCGAVLRGDITEMESWRTECRTCRRLADRHDVRVPEDPEPAGGAADRQTGTNPGNQTEGTA